MRRFALCLLVLFGCRGKPVTPPAPDLEVLSPATQLDATSWLLAAGEVTVGIDAHRHISIGNRGTAPAAITKIAVRSGDVHLGMIELPHTIDPADTLDVDVVVTPRAVGALIAWLDVTTDDPKLSSFSVKVTAAATSGVIGAEKCQLVPTAAQLAFGSVPRGGFGVVVATIENKGAQSCELTGASLKGSTAFSLMDMPTGTLLPSHVVQLRVRYVPASGSDTGELDVVSNDPASPLVMMVSGSQSEPAACDLHVVPHPLSFGRVGLGSEVPLPFELWNFGTGACPQATAALTTGSTSSDFSLAFTAGDLAPGAKLTGTVTLKPTIIGAISGTLTAGSDTVVVTGEGATAQLCGSPQVLDFGTVAAGAVSTLPFAITNCGLATATVTSITTDPGSAVEFTVVQGIGPFVIAPGDKVTASVRYAPMDSGPHGGSVNGLVSLRGNVPPSCTQVISCAPLSLSFGTVHTSQTSMLSFTCRNSGTSTLIVQSVKPTTGSNADFSVAMGGTAGLQLNPGKSLPVTISFRPSSVGAESGTIEVVHDACGAPQHVAVVGTGAP